MILEQQIACDRCGFVGGRATSYRPLDMHRDKLYLQLRLRNEGWLVGIKGQPTHCPKCRADRGAK